MTQEILDFPLRTIPVESLQIGDQVILRNRWHSFAGVITKINRVTIAFNSSVFGHEVDFNFRKDNMSGAEVCRSSWNIGTAWDGIRVVL